MHQTSQFCFQNRSWAWLLRTFATIQAQSTIISCLDYWSGPYSNFSYRQDCTTAKMIFKKKKRMWFSYTEPFNSLITFQTISYRGLQCNPCPDLIPYLLILMTLLLLTALWVLQAPRSAPASGSFCLHHISHFPTIFKSQVCPSIALPAHSI